MTSLGETPGKGFVQENRDKNSVFERGLLCSWLSIWLPDMRLSLFEAQSLHELEKKTGRYGKRRFIAVVRGLQKTMDVLSFSQFMTLSAPVQKATSRVERWLFDTHQF